MPLVRSIEISTAPAPSEPERSVIETPSARPARTRRLPVAHLGDCLEALPGLGNDRHLLEPELDRIHAGVRRHLIDHALDREGVEHVAHGAPVLEPYAVRDAAHLDLLVGHAVVGILIPVISRNWPSPTTQCFQPVTVPEASVAASRHWNDCGRNMPCGEVFLARPDQLDRTVDALGDQRALGRVVADRAPAEAAAHVALVEVDLLLLEAERLGDGLARLVRRLAAFPDLGLVAGDRGTTAFSGSICA